MQYEVNDFLTDEEVFLYGASEGETIYDLMKDYSSDGALKKAGDKYGDMQLVLRIDGKKIASGNPAKITKRQTTKVQINTMGNDFELTKECVVGATYSIVLDYQNMSAYKMIDDIENMQQLKKDLNESNLLSIKYAGKLLEFIGDTYFSELDVYCNMLSEQSDVFITRNLGIVFVGYEPIITPEINNLDYTVEKTGNVNIDVISTTFNTTSRNSDSEMERKVQYSIGMVSSQLESSVIDQIFDIQSVSSSNIIRYSKLNNIDICMVSSLNNDDINNLSVNSNAKEIIKDSLNEGYIIAVPEKDITINDWTGCGYIAYDPAGGTAKYMLSRDTSSNGGSGSSSISLTSMIAVFFSTEALLGSAVFCANALTAISFAGIIPFIGTTLVAAASLALLIISFDLQVYTFDLVYKAENGDSAALQELKVNNYIDITMASITTSAAIASRVCNSFYKESRVIEKTEKYGSSAVEGAMKNSDDMADTFRNAQKLEEQGFDKKTISSALEFGDSGLDVVKNNKYYREIIKDANNYTDYLNAAGTEIRVTKQKANTILDSINAKLNSSTDGTRIEAKVADFINKNTNETVVQFGCSVKLLNNNAVGDIDVATNNYFIEVKKSFKQAKESQLKKYTDIFDKYFFNFENKKVILYVDEPIDMNEYIQATINNYNDMGITVVNSLDELLEVLK